MDLQQKDAYIAEHLMKLEEDTLRFMVADLTSEVERLNTENTALIRAKVVNIMPPTMPESELVGHLQKLISELQVELYRVRHAKSTANADLQQRMDAAEEALRVAQGEVEGLKVTNRYLGGNNVSLYQALDAAKTETLAGDNEAAGLHLKCIGYLGQIIAAGRKQEEAESALTAANSRVERLRGALGKILHGEYEFVKYHARQVAAKALADDAKEGM